MLPPNYVHSSWIGSPYLDRNFVSLSHEGQNILTSNLARVTYSFATK